MRDNTEEGQRQMSNDPLLKQDCANGAKPQKGIMSLTRSRTMRGHESKAGMPLLAQCQASFCMAKLIIDQKKILIGDNEQPQANHN